MAGLPHSFPLVGIELTTETDTTQLDWNSTIRTEDR